MRKLLTVIILLFCMTTNAEVYETLSVHLKNGTNTQFLLNEEPKITFGETTINVESSTLTMEFDKTKVLRFTYSTGASIEGVKINDKPFIQHGDKLLFNNLTNGYTITIYNVNGMMMQVKQIMNDNNCTISIADLSAGIYIVNVNKESYKIIKR